LVDQFEGKKLNSPNDVVVKSDDTIWFTDPPYGILSDYEGKASTSEYGGAHVFRFNPATGKLEVVADDFNKPNGIAFSPDEKTLYVVVPVYRTRSKANTIFARSRWIGKGG